MLLLQRMGDEVDGQGQGLDTLHSRAETTVGRIKDVNNKSQLRKFSVSVRCQFLFLEKKYRK